MNQFTQKSLEAVQNAQTIAQEYGNQQIEQVHLLYALLEQENGLIPQLLGGMGLTVPSLEAAVRKEVEELPRVTVGGGREAGKVYIAADVDKALNRAEAVASSMKDEYVSVEHLLLALVETANGGLKDLFRTYNITKEGVLKALSAIRGNQRVTSDNPEETYDALKKYGSDLVERARQNKLDPVIGRDDEIRNVIRILSRKSKNNPVLIGEPGVGKTASPRDGSSSSSTSSTPSWARARPRAPWMQATSSSPCWPGASSTASAPPPSTSIASISKRTRPWSAGSSPSWSASPRWRTPSPSSAA